MSENCGRLECDELPNLMFCCTRREFDASIITNKTASGTSRLANVTGKKNAFILHTNSDTHKQPLRSIAQRGGTFPQKNTEAAVTEANRGRRALMPILDVYDNKSRSVGENMPRVQNVASIRKELLKQVASGIDKKYDIDD